MKGKDEIKDLFSEKLGNFEAQVRPDMWTNIASQIGGTTSVVASTGLSLLSKTMIGLGIGAAVVTTVILITESNTDIEDKKAMNTTSNTNSPMVEDVLNNTITEAEEKASSTLERATKKQVKTSSPALLVDQEVDQDQNFRSDVSLIDVKKEIPVKESVDTKNKTEREKTIVSNKEEELSTKAEVKIEDVIEKHELKQSEAPKVTYTIEKLPNIFTPNGDGNNDFLSVSSEGLIDFTIVVLDDNQKVVFESNNPDFKWDGTDKFGNKVSPGTYGYYIIAQDSNGNKVNKFTSLQVVF